MSAFNDNFERQVVPRWRDSEVASRSPDLLPLKHAARPAVFVSHLEGKLEEFRRFPSVGVAADVASSALLTGEMDALDEVSGIILSPSSTAPAYLRHLVKAGLAGRGPRDAHHSTSMVHRAEIARLRRLLMVEPRNPILLMDLARHQATLGLHDRAEQTARIAVALAPNNRWILRSTSKLLTVYDKPLEAHRLLTQTKATASDPWLVAAELATAQAANVSPKFWRQAQSFLVGRSLGPEHLSELASAVGTFELLEGKTKKAKEWFRLSLKSPTENALAQAKWAERKTRNGFHVESLFESVGMAYEAACFSAYNEQDMIRAMGLAMEWMNDEPFSTVPASMASYLASLLDDYDGVIDATSRGLMATPHDECMMNNRIFALISSGSAFGEDEEEVAHWAQGAARALRERQISENSNVSHILANFGLLFYRMGDFVSGRRLYHRAIETAQSAGSRTTEVNALMFFTREALIAKEPWAPELLERAKKAASSANAQGALFYIAKMEALARSPDKAAEILSPKGAAVLQGKGKTLALSYRVEQTPDGFVLWVPRKKG